MCVCGSCALHECKYVIHARVCERVYVRGCEFVYELMYARIFFVSIYNINACVNNCIVMMRILRVEQRSSE